jgi:hypothetical protein
VGPVPYPLLFFFLVVPLLLQTGGLLCVAPTQTRRRVCRLQLLLALASAVILGSEFRFTYARILLHQFRHCTIWEARSRIYVPQEYGGLVIAQGTGSFFRRLVKLAKLRRRHSHPHTCTLATRTPRLAAAELLLNNIHKLSSHLTGNTLRLRYRDLPVNAVW